MIFFVALDKKKYPIFSAVSRSKFNVFLDARKSFGYCVTNSHKIAAFSPIRKGGGQKDTFALTKIRWGDRPPAPAAPTSMIHGTANER